MKIQQIHEDPDPANSWGSDQIWIRRAVCLLWTPLSLSLFLSFLVGVLGVDGLQELEGLHCRVPAHSRDSQCVPNLRFFNIFIMRQADLPQKVSKRANFSRILEKIASGNWMMGELFSYSLWQNYRRQRYIFLQ